MTWSPPDALRCPRCSYWTVGENAVRNLRRHLARCRARKDKK